MASNKLLQIYKLYPCSIFMLFVCFYMWNHTRSAQLFTVLQTFHCRTYHFKFYKIILNIKKQNTTFSFSKNINSDLKCPFVYVHSMQNNRDMQSISFVFLFLMRWFSNREVLKIIQSCILFRRKKMQVWNSLHNCPCRFHVSNMKPTNT